MSRRGAIRRAMANFDGIYGKGAARNELIVGVVACLALVVNVVGWAVVAGAGS